MARPERNNVDYFPFLCKEGKAMFYIEEKYGNDGFATWVKILRSLAVTNYHFLNLSDEMETMFLASKCKISEETLTNIITDLAKLGEINKMLWEENRVVYSDKFMESIVDAYSKRKNNPLSFEGLLKHLTSLGVLKPDKSNLKGVINPQSKVKYTKEDKSKVNNIIERENEFRFLANKLQHEYSLEMIEEFCDYWTESKPNGKKMKFEMQKTFDISRRLKKWSSNNFNQINNAAATKSEKPLTYSEKYFGRRINEDGSFGDPI